MESLGSKKFCCSFSATVIIKLCGAGYNILAEVEDTVETNGGRRRTSYKDYFLSGLDGTFAAQCFVEWGPRIITDGINASADVMISHKHSLAWATAILLIAIYTTSIKKDPSLHLALDVTKLLCSFTLAVVLAVSINGILNCYISSTYINACYLFLFFMGKNVKAAA